MHVEDFDRGEGKALRMHVGSPGTVGHRPLVLGAEMNFSCLDLELRGWDELLAHRVGRLAESMRSATDGMWLGFVRVPEERPLALIQSNRGPFYEDRHGLGYAGTPARDRGHRHRGR